MRFLKLSRWGERGERHNGINLDSVVWYSDNPGRDEVSLYMASTGNSLSSGMELSGEDRRAFFDAIGR